MEVERDNHLQVMDFQVMYLGWLCLLWNETSGCESHHQNPIGSI